MDPNTALDSLRDLTTKVIRGEVDAADRESVADQIAETFQGLDEWLSKGGFLPEQWVGNRTIVG